MRRLFCSLTFLFFILPNHAFEFPKDHTFHTEYAIEWCYFVGNVTEENGNEYGYELSFFKGKFRENEEIFPVHFAISDITNKKHYTTQTIERKIGKLATYTNSLIRSGDYKIKILDDSEFQITANPRNKNISLELNLKASRKEIIFHGDNGYSIKSNRDKNIYSYYYSIPRLQTSGYLKIGDKKIEIKSGISWMDHEWSYPISLEANANDSTHSLTSKENSWDWICLNLDDGSDLMLFNFRKTSEDSSETFGTLRTSDNKIIKFKNENEIAFFSNTSNWKSPETKKTYPMKWKIQSKDLDLDIESRFPNQEFIGTNTTGNSYWEGSIRAQGTKDGKQIKGKGYLELKGY